ncbi:hypothetical protein LTR81_025650 [Elasticomyces elasticus]
MHMENLYPSCFVQDLTVYAASIELLQLEAPSTLPLFNTRFGEDSDPTDGYVWGADDEAIENWQKLQNMFSLETELDDKAALSTKRVKNLKWKVDTEMFWYEDFGAVIRQKYLELEISIERKCKLK